MSQDDRRSAAPGSPSPGYNQPRRVTPSASNSMSRRVIAIASWVSSKARTDGTGPCVDSSSNSASSTVTAPATGCIRSAGARQAAVARDRSGGRRAALRADLRICRSASPRRPTAPNASPLRCGPCATVRFAITPSVWAKRCDRRWPASTPPAAVFGCGRSPRTAPSRVAPPRACGPGCTGVLLGRHRWAVERSLAWHRPLPTTDPTLRPARTPLPGLPHPRLFHDQLPH